MEDAMIINKSAYERGFGHGAVYKSYLRELNETTSMGNGGAKSRYRMVNPGKYRDDQRIELESKGLDSDGLPYIGKKLEHGSAEQCTYD